MNIYETPRHSKQYSNTRIITLDNQASIKGINPLQIQLFHSLRREIPYNIQGVTMVQHL